MTQPIKEDLVEKLRWMSQCKRNLLFSELSHLKELVLYNTSRDGHDYKLTEEDMNFVSTKYGLSRQELSPLYKFTKDHGLNGNRTNREFRREYLSTAKK